MAKPFKIQLVETFITLMTAAFGMVAALAWNEAIKKVISQFLAPGDEVFGLVVYAVVVTVVAVVGIVLIARTLGKMKESLELEENKN